MLAVVTGLLLAWAPAAHAQMSAMPPALQEKMAELGPRWGKHLAESVKATFDAYTPLLGAAPKAGVKVTKDLAYGPDPRHRLDVHQPEGKSGVPVIAFFHGGAYVRGDKSVNEEIYGNVLTYFARQGMLGVNATYRLAPGAPWPAGAQDVGAVVAWLKREAAGYGGDANRIVLIGHSAGATHVASYVFDQTLQPQTGSGVAGAVLMSGRYRLELTPNDPNLANMQAYFGRDAGQYLARSPISHVPGSRIRAFLVIAEFDNPGLDVLGAELFSALCRRDNACPRFTRLVGHNHISMVSHFNTADDALGREIRDFVRSGR
jgi:acetyl esterase/lipase